MMSMTEENRWRHRLTRAQRRKVRPVSVWFIEDLLFAGQWQVWGPRENWDEVRKGGSYG
jgi:hypothetical protein